VSAGRDAVWDCHEIVPGLTTSIDNGVIGFIDADGELVDLISPSTAANNVVFNGSK